jgi:hypothetical protein
MMESRANNQPSPEVTLNNRYDENHFGCSRCLVWSLIFEAALVIAILLFLILCFAVREGLAHVAS